MSIKDLVLCKNDLNNYYDKDLSLLARNRGIKADTRNDLCWLLSLNIMSGIQRGEMIRDPAQSLGQTPIATKSTSLLKKMHKPAPIASTSGFADRYNLKDDECMWPTRMGGYKSMNCNFNYNPYLSIVLTHPTTRGKMIIEVVEVPTGTKLYRGTKNPERVHNSINDWPATPGQQIIWFASTFDHTMPLGPVKIHEFTTNTPMYLMFTRNITKQFNVSTGKNILPILYNISHKLKERTGLVLDGYIGCNECEYGLFKNSLDKLNYPSVILNAPYVE